MGCTLSIPELSGGATYYVNPTGAAAGNAFGIGAIFTADVFTCGGAVVTPAIVHGASTAAQTTYLCNPYTAGKDTSILCPSIARSTMSGTYSFSVYASLGSGSPTTLYSAGFSVVNTATPTVTSGTTFTRYTWTTASVSTPTTFTLVRELDVGPMFTVTSYGATRHINIAVTSTITSTVTKVTTAKTCSATAPVRRDIPAIEEPEEEEIVQLVKRHNGYKAFDGIIGGGGTVTIYSTILYTPNYYGTITKYPKTVTATSTETNSFTATSTITVHDHEPTFTTITNSKTATVK
ncbi:hypothetical protein TWF694_000296 [Orbilia ellipsospora]|uniref:Uncharacterized protein n=1 Tax=Orbilia ellipsospora TaxID=2528407 RepID=A0AAV9XPR4_9PEZI